MAATPAVVQIKASARFQGATSGAVTLNSTTGAGNLLVVCSRCFDLDGAQPTNFAVSDNKSNIFALAQTAQYSSDNDSTMEMHYAANINAGASHQITVNYGDSIYGDFVVAEVTGTLNSPLDAHLSASDAGVVLSSGPVAPSQACFLVGQAWVSAIGTIGQTWAGSQDELAVVNADIGPMNITSKQADGVTTATWLSTGNGPWVCIVAAFKIPATARPNKGGPWLARRRKTV